MEVEDLVEEFDKGKCEQFRRLLESYPSIGKEDCLEVLSRLGRKGTGYALDNNKRTKCTTVLVLVGEREPFDSSGVQGGVLVEYFIDSNCGLVRGLVLKDQSDCGRQQCSEQGRLLMERAALALHKVGNVPLQGTEWRKHPPWYVPNCPQTPIVYKIPTGAQKIVFKI